METASSPADLASFACTACRKDSPRASAEETAAWLPLLAGWKIVEVEGVARLERDFSFIGFARALAFTNRVGALAEQAGHHPLLLTEWGHVRVSWWTHAIGGLHRNDFILAARTSQAALEEP